MNVFALIGKSGTGKSYKAILLTKKLEIEYIIDDGLLIKGNKIVAGKSAKRENTRVAAVKTACFTDYSHRLSVKNTIVDCNPKSILIIGTSEKMIRKIADALELGSIYKKICIEDIASKEDIEIAKYQRSVEGKHIIPVPTFEVKKDFSGYFMDSLKIRKKKDNIKKEIYEKTVMRPTFSYLGGYKISDDAIKDIIKYNTRYIEEISKVLNIYIENYTEGIIVYLEVELYLEKDLYHIYNIADISEKIQETIGREIEYMTSINILSIDVAVKSLKIKR